MPLTAEVERWLGMWGWQQVCTAPKYNTWYQYGCTLPYLTTKSSPETMSLRERLCPDLRQTKSPSKTSLSQAKLTLKGRSHQTCVSPQLPQLYQWIVICIVWNAIASNVDMNKTALHGLVPYVLALAYWYYTENISQSSSTDYITLTGDDDNPSRWQPIKMTTRQYDNPYRHLQPAGLSHGLLCYHRMIVPLSTTASVTKRRTLYLCIKHERTRCSQRATLQPHQYCWIADNLSHNACRMTSLHIWPYMTFDWNFSNIELLLFLEYKIYWIISKIAIQFHHTILCMFCYIHVHVGSVVHSNCALK